MAAKKKKPETITMVAVVREGGAARMITAEVPLTTRLKVTTGKTKDLPVALDQAMRELEKMAGIHL